MINYDEVELGMIVNYHSTIGGPVTKFNCKVKSDPWQIGHGEWVVMISGIHGGVSLNALTRPHGQPTNDKEVRKNKEEIYDAEIKPLMSQIIKICIKNEIPLITEFHIPTDESPGLCVSSSIVEHMSNIPVHMLKIMLLQHTRRTKPYP